jgi:hypothetical protein
MVLCINFLFKNINFLDSLQGSVQVEKSTLVSNMVILFLLLCIFVLLIITFLLCINFFIFYVLYQVANFSKA